MRTIAASLAALLCAAIVAIAAMLPLPAHADAIAQIGADWVRITARPCSDEKVRARIQVLGGDPLDFRAATAHLQGQDYSACWAPMGNAARLVYDDGDQGIVPGNDLKPVPET